MIGRTLVSIGFEGVGSYPGQTKIVRWPAPDGRFISVAEAPWKERIVSTMEHVPFIKTTEVSRYYRRGDSEVRAVDQVSLALEKGGFLAIVGASGSGKSTLLNLLAGLDTPTAGEITVAGTTLGRMTRRELSAYRAQRVGVVFQAFNLVPHLTALKNVELALYFSDTPRADRHRKAAEMLERLGLADRTEHRPADLSGGEQQRVALARALVKRPEILLADEPTGNLDRENTAQLAKLLTSLHRDGLTIILVTHDLALAERLAGRVVRMHYGRLVNGAEVTE